MRAPATVDGWIIQPGDIVASTRGRDPKKLDVSLFQGDDRGCDPDASPFGVHPVDALGDAPVSRRYRVLRVGSVRVTERMHDPAWAYAHFDVELEDVDADGRVCSSDSGHMWVTNKTHAVRDVERAIYCNGCNIHFDPNFITYEHDHMGRNTRKKFLYIGEDGHVGRTPDLCDRCRFMNPQRGFFWRVLRRRLVAESVARYWYSLVHTPAYIARLVDEARADCAPLARSSV